MLLTLLAGAADQSPRAVLPAAGQRSSADLLDTGADRSLRSAAAESL